MCVILCDYSNKLYISVINLNKMLCVWGTVRVEEVLGLGLGFWKDYETELRRRCEKGFAEKLRSSELSRRRGEESEARRGKARRRRSRRR